MCFLSWFIALFWFIFDEFVGSLFDTLGGNCYLVFILIPKDKRENGFNDLDLLLINPEAALLGLGSMDKSE